MFLICFQFLICLKQCEESIVAVQAGRVSSPNFDEIILCTYTGWIFGLTTEPRANSNASLSPQIGVKVQELRYLQIFPNFQIFQIIACRIAYKDLLGTFSGNKLNKSNNSVPHHFINSIGMRLSDLRPEL